MQVGSQEKVTRRRLFGLIPLPMLFGPKPKRDLGHDWEFAIISASVSRGISEETALKLYDGMGPYISDPDASMEVRHRGRVVKRYQGRWATAEEAAGVGIPHK